VRGDALRREQEQPVGTPNPVTTSSTTSWSWSLACSGSGSHGAVLRLRRPAAGSARRRIPRRRDRTAADAMDRRSGWGQLGPVAVLLADPSASHAAPSSPVNEPRAATHVPRTGIGASTQVTHPSLICDSRRGGSCRAAWLERRASLLPADIFSDSVLLGPPTV
jgi:hypothetical protein